MSAGQMPLADCVSRVERALRSRVGRSTAKFILACNRAGLPAKVARLYDAASMPKGCSKPHPRSEPGRNS